MSLNPRKRRNCPDSAEPLMKRLKDMEVHLDELQRSSNDFSERIAAFCRNRRDEPEEESEPESQSSSGEEDDESGAEINSGDESDSDVDDVSEAEDDEEYGRCLVSKKKRSVLEIRTSWECTKCHKKIRGKRYHRLHHIAVHENLKLECPIAKCTARLGVHSLRPHLAAHHKMKSGNLSKEERKRQDQERAICYKKGMQFEAHYFPERNLSKILKKKSVANDVCKLCDAKISSLPGQRDHIAGHLGMKIPCPLSSCDYAGLQSKMFHHLNTVHLKKITSLNQKRQKRWKESQEAYNKAVSDVKHEYF